MGITAELAEWSSSLSFEEIPQRVHTKTKAQILSVLGAVFAGRHSEGATSALEVARSWGSGAEATALLSGERLPRLNAIFANACASVSFDFDDYLFAGHTGHSAVCTALAYGELEAAHGRDVLAAITVGNEVGGRLGASLLFGPHNGQMWSYIHVLEAVCIASRFYGLDAGRTANAIGIAFTQPPYPLMPAFMGPDGKLLIPASTTVEGCRAAELAAHGWTGNTSILEDEQGFLKKFNENNLGWIMSGFGEAWLSDTLSYKIVPGCAYIDTAVDAFKELALEAAPDEINVKASMFTAGMEGFSTTYRSADRLEPISVNFSVALSLGLMMVAGDLAPEYLSHKYLDANREAIEAAAAKVTVEHDAAMDSRAAGDFSLANIFSARTLEGVSLENYVMSFPAKVTVGGSSATVSTPLAAAGRPWDETIDLVRQKFTNNFPGNAPPVIDAVDRLEEMDDVRDLVALLTAASPRA